VLSGVCAACPIKYHIIAPGLGLYFHCFIPKIKHTYSRRTVRVPCALSAVRRAVLAPGSTAREAGDDFDYSLHTLLFTLFSKSIVPAMTHVPCTMTLTIV
jgi:hypothetical protein